MEKSNIIRTKVINQIRQSIDDASALEFRALPKMQSELVTPDNFTIKNKGKSPPGKARSRGSCLGGLNRDWIPYAPKKLIINNKEEIFQISNKQYSNFNNNLIFKIMKKQILLLVLAFFATVTAFGQMKAGSAPLPLVGCTNDFLHPLAGVSYSYKALVNPTGGQFQWWATKDVDFIKTTAGVTTNNSNTKLAVGTDLIAASTNYGVAGSLIDTVGITWSSSILSTTTAGNPTFVVVQNNATGTNCANNLKVYPILPINGFTVDIKNMDQAKLPLAYATPYATCVSNIASAKYDAATKAIITDYGINVLYYEVVAANFTGNYTPSFKVSGLAPTGQTVTSLELYTDAAFATTAIATTLAAGVYSPATALTIDPSVTNTTNGVSIYVKLTIANGTHETLTDDAIVVAVNGTNASSEKDVVNTACNTQTDFEDTATQTLTKRPTIASVPAGLFVTP